MSAADERDPAQGGQGGADEHANLDLKAIFDVLVPVVWSLVMVGVMGLIAFRGIIRYLEKEEVQEEAQTTFPTGCDIDSEEDEDEEESEESEAAGFSECRILRAETEHTLGYFTNDITAPKSLSLLAKEALLCYYDSEYEADQSEEEEEEEEEKTEEPGEKKYL
ncbi:PREDICTED: nucleolin-like [Chinchilla lanigera]|uniref:nucleolin-like n=1 Tax=Chinchilla lanigera TaxID=34839 RepID=UPI00069693F3|nr:PREDICTED: nucleolin-like [Chinchilla lanigera]